MGEPMALGLPPPGPPHPTVSILTVISMTKGPHFISLKKSKKQNICAAQRSWYWLENVERNHLVLEVASQC